MKIIGKAKYPHKVFKKWECCGNDLTIKSTAVRLFIINEFDFDDVTFAKEAFENIVNFRIKTIKYRKIVRDIYAHWCRQYNSPCLWPEFRTSR